MGEIDKGSPNLETNFHRIVPQEYTEDHEVLEDTIAVLKGAMQKLEGPNKDEIADAVNEASINKDNKQSDIDIRNIRSSKRGQEVRLKY